MDYWISRRGREPRPLIKAPAASECRACVVIPVRDEAANLEATLRALADQRDESGSRLPGRRYEVIVLANNCRDESADLCRRFGEANPGFALHVVEVDIPAPRAHVGTARKLLMDEACRRLHDAGRSRGVIASTDGDTRVGRTWLSAILDEVAAGADAVGGDVRTDRPGRRSMGVEARGRYLVDLAYRRRVDELEARLDPDPSDPWPRHHHHTGASLALTAEAYARVGGLPPLPCSEDVALVDALRLADMTLRHSPRVRVTTSARRVGRAAGGMADTLLRWSLEAQGPSLEDPAAVEVRILRRRRLRDLWRACRAGRPRPVPGRLAESLGLRPDALAARIAEAPTFGSLLGALRREAASSLVGPGLGLDAAEAMARLKARLADLRLAAAPREAMASRLLEQVEPVGLLPAAAPML